MQALVKRSHETKDVAIVRMSRPEPGPGQVLVRTQAVGLCGSDVHAWRHDEGYDWVASPVILGHEAVGTVEAIGDDVDPSWRGRRVVPISIDGCGTCEQCRGGQRHICAFRDVLGLSFHGACAEFFAIEVNRLIVVDAQLPTEAAVLTEPLAIAVHAVRQLTQHAPSGPAHVVVTGPGPIGLMAALVLKAHGHAVTLVGTEQDRAVRLALAERLGLTTSLGSVSQAPSLWLEASGSGAALAAAINGVASGGTIAVPALFGRIPTVDVNVLTRNEVDLRGCYGATRADYEAALDHLRSNPQMWQSLVTAFPLAAAPQVLESVSRGELIKAVLVP